MNYNQKKRRKKKKKKRKSIWIKNSTKIFMLNSQNYARKTEKLKSYKFSIVLKNKNS